MLDIGEDLVRTLQVTHDRIALTKEFCKDSGQCTVNVTVLGYDTASAPEGFEPVEREIIRTIYLYDAMNELEE